MISSLPRSRTKMKDITASLLILVPATMLAVGCSEGPADEGAHPEPARDAIYFDVTTARGLPAPHPVETWAPGTWFMPEIIGGGCALFDADGDGDLDILQVRSPPPHSRNAPHFRRYFEQQEDGTFRDETERSGLGDPGYGQGVAIGDIDGDGDDDVFFLNLGSDSLFRNRGDGTFEDATAAAGISGEHWSNSGAFFDYDRDGDLDLFAVHYVEFDPQLECKGARSQRDYCGPHVYPATRDVLYRNDGSGHFTDVSERAGIKLAGKGLGLACVDLTNDGWPDVYVANDQEVNHLWVNDQHGGFTEEAIMRGAGFNLYGEPEASMGVAVGDANGDGLADLFMTHIAEETNTLYLASAGGLFKDVSARSGMSAMDLNFTGFGCAFVDWDNDGDLDVAIANGRVKRGPVLETAPKDNYWSHYVEPGLLLENLGAGEFADAGDAAGEFARELTLNRGLASGDIDRDGDLDLLICDPLGGLRLYENRAPRAHWLRVRIMSEGRDAIGALAVLEIGGRRMLRPLVPGQSYASSSEEIVHFGLGAAEGPAVLEITWPDGNRERFLVTETDRVITVQQGTGEGM